MDYRGVTIMQGAERIDFGVYNDTERKDLAKKFIDAAEKLLEGLKDETT